MALEIERKFLIRDDSWRELVTATKHFTQAYFASDPKCSIRVRIEDDQANLNFKSGQITVKRLEYEFPIPLPQATEMLAKLVSSAVIDKKRHYVPFQGHVWEIDEFHGANAGLLVAEVELASEDEKFVRPAWIGDEVSDDPRYYNVNLVRHPYCEWQSDEEIIEI